MGRRQPELSGARLGNKPALNNLFLQFRVDDAVRAPLGLSWGAPQLSQGITSPDIEIAGRSVRQ